MLRFVSYLLTVLSLQLLAAPAHQQHVVALSSTAATCQKLAAAQEQIMKFLDSSGGKGKFHVQGWRWHTMSLVREAGRLHRLARRVAESPNAADSDLSDIAKAVKYVVGFNMKGLHKIESDLFFPWVRKKVNEADDSKIIEAFDAVMDKLEFERRAMEEVGKELSNQLSVAPANASPAKIAELAEAVADQSGKIVNHGRSMLELEDSILVPMIARVVPESEQKSFNNQVIRNLGIWDSRLHLVAMHEAVLDLNDEKEAKLFQEVIPSIPRSLIPRWKRLLYEPQAGVLDTR